MLLGLGSNLLLFILSRLEEEDNLRKTGGDYMNTFVLDEGRRKE